MGCSRNILLVAQIFLIARRSPSVVQKLRIVSFKASGPVDIFFETVHISIAVSGSLNRW